MPPLGAGHWTGLPITALRRYAALRGEGCASPGPPNTWLSACNC